MAGRWQTLLFYVVCFVLLFLPLSPASCAYFTSSLRWGWWPPETVQVLCLLSLLNVSVQQAACSGKGQLAGCSSSYTVGSSLSAWCCCSSAATRGGLLSDHLPPPHLKILQLEARQILRLTLTGWVSSLWCVCTVDGRERRQGLMLAVIQSCFMLPHLSASHGGIFSSQTSELPANWKTRLTDFDRLDLYFFLSIPPLLWNVKHSGGLSDKYEIDAAAIDYLGELLSTCLPFIESEKCLGWKGPLKII